MNNDLISREALRKAFHERIWHFDKSSWDEANSLIDNAPSVERPKYILKTKNLTAEDKKRFQEELNKSAGGLLAIPDNYEIIPIERPHGKWIMVTEPDGFTHSKCSNCNQFNDWGDVPFCPWCGADMRGEHE